jgi:hypothetical protein
MGDEKTVSSKPKPRNARGGATITKYDMHLKRHESRPPTKWLHDPDTPLLEDLVKIRTRYAHHEYMEPWRIADMELNFSDVDRGDKGFLNSRETRLFLLNFGIPWGKTIDTVQAGKYSDFPTSIDKIESMQSAEAIKDHTWRLLVHSDIEEANGDRATGFISFEKIYKRLEDHGMDDDELYLFLTPYKRDDGKVEYAKMFRDLFPPNREAKI